jgi:site-specific recombinase XerD
MSAAGGSGHQTATEGLADAGHDTRALQAWLGHKNIQHTVRYTELAPDRFKNFWR